MSIPKYVTCPFQIKLYVRTKPKIYLLPLSNRSNYLKVELWKEVWHTPAFIDCRMCRTEYKSSIPVTGLRGLQGSRRLRFPDF